MRAVAAAVAISVLISPSHAGEPRHKGKTLSQWVALMNRKPPSHAAAHALAEFGEAGIPPLIKAMRSHPNGAIRWISHISLAKIGDAALPELDKIMRDGDIGARIQAVLAFEKMLGREALPRLCLAIKDKDNGVRVRAHGAMVRLGEPKGNHLPKMIHILRTDARARWLAAEALGQCGPKAAGAEDALAEVLHDPSKSAAERALQALEQMKTETAMKHVYPLMAERLADPAASVASKLKALVRIGRVGAAAEPTLPALRKLAANDNEDILVRGYAAWAAEQVDPRPADEPGRTYHVAQKHPKADDANAGAKERPWLTIQRAAEALRPGDTVFIHDGVYREFVRPFVGGTGYDRMITYRAAPGAEPVLKGSDPWRPKWRGEGEGLWSAPYKRHSWDQPENWPKPRHGAMHRAEQVFVDGKLLVHVDTMQELKTQPRRFLTDDDAGRLWVHLEGDAAPAGRSIERSTRQQVFAPAVRGLGHIRVQGLTMLHAAAPECNGACWHRHGHRAMLSVRAGHHWIIEDNTIEWGNAQGLDIGGEGFAKDLSQQPIVSNEKGCHQARHNRVNYHGVAGIVGWAGRTQHLLLEDNVTNYNCQKGNLYQYESAGVKLHNAEDCIIRRHRAHRNNAFGIWLDYRCLRNRITQCILTENMCAGFFFEVSAGPLLVDNNVILASRDAPRGNWAEGIYSHDGNHATYVNNYIRGCRGHGVRIRNLFARVADGKPTTTSHNRVWNNFIFDNTRGELNFNPDVPRAEHNHSDHNIFWRDGKPLHVRLDFGGTKRTWESTEVGKALGKSGKGMLTVPFNAWQEVAGEDAHSLALPEALLFRGLTPERILDKLTSLWPDDAPGLDGGYGEVTARPALSLAHALCPKLRDASFVRAIRLGPREGVQIWRSPKSLLAFRWRGSERPRFLPAPTSAFLDEPQPGAKQPATLAAGDALHVPVGRDTRVAYAGLDARVEAAELVVSAAADKPHGEYGVILQRGNTWSPMPVAVKQAYHILSVDAVAPAGHSLRVQIENRRAAKVDATVVVHASHLAEPLRTTRMLAPRSVTPVEVRLPESDSVDAAAIVKVEVRVPGATLNRSQLVSFARAPRSGRWQDAASYAIDGFPDGSFPPGAEAFALYQGGFGAKWAARYDDAALHVRVDVSDAKHLQTKPVNTMWLQDSAQLLVRAKPNAAPLAIDLSKRSDNGQVRVFRCRWPGSKGIPGPLPKGFSGDVTRKGRRTTYTATIPWTMLGLSTAAAKGTAIDFSVLVNSDDGRGRVGIQWFFGIHTHRGRKEHMGTLWLE